MTLSAFKPGDIAWVSIRYVLPTGAALLTTNVAGATRDFPDVVRAHYGLTYEPPCSICHVKGNTGPGTVQTPVGFSLRARGMVARDDASLERALDSLEADETDSDNDGQTDVAELEAQIDPNSPGNTLLDTASDPSFGCGGGEPTGRRQGAAAPVLAVALASWMLGRLGRLRRVRSET
jgi:hypothetical protein